MKQTRIEADLKQSAKEERQAARNYRTRRARAAGDPKTQKVYSHIIPEEDPMHNREFTRRLRDIQKEKTRVRVPR